MADAIPGARFDIIRGDGSSHVVPIERPDDFTRKVAWGKSRHREAGGRNGIREGAGAESLS